MSKIKTASEAKSTLPDRKVGEKEASRDNPVSHSGTAKDDADLPGAGGPLSAGANEDTYD